MGERVQETYLLPNGTIVYLKEKDLLDEGFGKSDPKIMIYDLEKRIEEINQSGGIVSIPFEKVERLVNECGLEEAYNMLETLYPDGFRVVIYSDESMRTWERKSSKEEG